MRVCWRTYAGSTRELRLCKAPRSAYIGGVPSGTMDINALAISGSDPGAVPGGSTKYLRWGILGPKQDRRTSKGVSFVPVRYHRYRFTKHNCQRQSCSGCSRCVSSAKHRKLKPSPLARAGGVRRHLATEACTSPSCFSAHDTRPSRIGQGSARAPCERPDPLSRVAPCKSLASPPIS